MTSPSPRPPPAIRYGRRTRPPRRTPSPTCATSSSYRARRRRLARRAASHRTSSPPPRCRRTITTSPTPVTGTTSSPPTRPPTTAARCRSMRSQAPTSAAREVARSFSPALPASAFKPTAATARITTCRRSSCSPTSSRSGASSLMARRWWGQQAHKARPVGMALALATPPRAPTATRRLPSPLRYGRLCRWTPPPMTSARISPSAPPPNTP